MAMKATNPAIKLVGASWSAPGWMKQSGAQQGWTNSNNYLNGYYTNTFANYFVKYIQTFAGFGVSIDYLSVQNEPLNSNSNYPTMYVGATDMANFTPILAKLLTQNNLNTKLMVYDHNTVRVYEPSADRQLTIHRINQAIPKQLSRRHQVTRHNWPSDGTVMRATRIGPRFPSLRRRILAFQTL